MDDSGERKPDEKGLSARYLALVFLMGVAACAVFFSLGFLVGYNERPSRGAATEQVTPPPLIPPTVNPPQEAARPAAKQPAPATTFSREPTVRPEPLPAKPAPESRPAAPPVAAPPRAPTGQAGEVGIAYTVQVVAAKNLQDAERLVKELKARGYAVFLVTPEYARANDNLFRVQVGPFATRDEAEKVRAKLVKEGFKPFIKH